MKTKRRRAGTREWGYRLPHTEYFTFVGTREEAIARGHEDGWDRDGFEIVEGRLTWSDDERSDCECNPDDEWFIAVGTPERIESKIP